MASFSKNMTEGSELKHILTFTLPLLIGNLFQQFYNIVDSVIVGKRLGSQALASVGATGSITFLFYTLCIGLSTGAGILTAQYFGSGRKREVQRYIVNSFCVSLLFGITIAAASFIAAPMLLDLLDTPKNIFNASLGYMRICCVGTVSVSLYNWINSIMRSLGDSKTPLLFLILASVLNAALDVLFVVVLNMGVNGAAWATITAQGVSAAGSIGFAILKNPYFKISAADAVPDGRAFKKCLRTGVPIAIQNAMISVSMVYLQKTANRFGEDVIAAYTATMRIEQLVQQPFSSLNAALSTFTGQNIGAGKRERVIRGYKRSLAAAMIFALSVFAVFTIFSESIISIFVDKKSVILIGAKALRLSAFFYCFLGVIHTTRGLLNGAGDVGYAMINGLAEVAGRIGFAVLLVHIPSVDYMAVWGTTCLTWTLTAAVSFVRYLSGKWEAKQLVNGYPPEKNKRTV
ncbi:MAG: MATE family efflux transporter [Oscillospiraceae bacterium]